MSGKNNQHIHQKKILVVFNVIKYCMNTNKLKKSILIYSKFANFSTSNFNYLLILYNHYIK